MDNLSNDMEDEVEEIKSNSNPRMSINNLCYDEEFDEKYKYKGPIFIISGTVEDKATVKFNKIDPQPIHGKDKTIWIKFEDTAKFQGKDAKEFFNSYNVEVPIADIFVSARLMKDKYTEAKKRDGTLKVWKAAKQPPTRNAKSQKKSAEQKEREKMYLAVDKGSCPNIWVNVHKTVSNAQKVVKYPGDTLISLDVLLNGSGTKADLAKVFKYIEITEAVVFRDIHTNQRNSDNLVGNDPWPGVANNLAIYPKRTPNILGSIMQLQEGVTCLNKTNISLTSKERWSFLDVPIPISSLNSKLKFDPQDINIFVQWNLNGNASEPHKITFQVISGQAAMFSRRNAETPRNLFFLSVPKSPFGLKFTVQHSLNNSLNEGFSNNQEKESSLLFCGVSFRPNNDQRNSFELPPLAFNRSTALMARFTICQNVIIDVPCLFHVL